MIALRISSSGVPVSKIVSFVVITLIWSFSNIIECLNWHCCTALFCGHWDNFFLHNFRRYFRLVTVFGGGDTWLLDCILVFGGLRWSILFCCGSLANLSTELVDIS
jgi:hypothetical protein